MCYDCGSSEFSTYIQLVCRLRYRCIYGMSKPVRVFVITYYSEKNNDEIVYGSELLY